TGRAGLAVCGHVTPFVSAPRSRLVSVAWVALAVSAAYATRSGGPEITLCKLPGDAPNTTRQISNRAPERNGNRCRVVISGKSPRPEIPSVSRRPGRCRLPFGTGRQIVPAKGL